MEKKKNLSVSPETLEKHLYYFAERVVFKPHMLVLVANGSLYGA